jgi:hypothetical protein
MLQRRQLNLGRAVAPCARRALIRARQLDPLQRPAQREWG